MILIELQMFGTYRQLQEATDDLRQSQRTLIAIEDAVKGSIFYVELPTYPEPAGVAASIGTVV